MAEHNAQFEWRGDGEEAEVVLYSPDEGFAEPAFERALPAARLPGVESPVYAAASSDGFGWVVASGSYAAPDLISAPVRGVLLSADVAVDELGLLPEELPRLISRRFSETRLPALNETGVGRVCEFGARAAAEDGFIEEEELAFFELPGSEADALGLRAVSAGTRDWSMPGEVRALRVGEVLDAEEAERLGLEGGALLLAVHVGTGELGRISLQVHRERILARVWSGAFEAEPDLPAAPLETEEAGDLLTAGAAAANFAAARATLLLYALRRAMVDIVGGVQPLASWTVGGFERRDEVAVHRRELAAIRRSGAVVAGNSAAVGTGAMLGSAPPFGAAEVEGRWPWEEAGLLERLAELERR